MNKAELVAAVATQLCKSRTETEAFVNTLLKPSLKRFPVVIRYSSQGLVLLRSGKGFTGWPKPSNRGNNNYSLIVVPGV